MDAVVPRRAIIIPRARSTDSLEVMPIESRTRGIIQSGAYGLLTICGPTGSGKTTAIQHLAAVLPPDSDIRFVDDGHIPRRGTERITFFTSSAPDHGFLASLQMALWTDDDLIEYLLATHRDDCQSIMFK